MIEELGAIRAMGVVIRKEDLCKITQEPHKIENGKCIDCGTLEKENKSC